MKLSNKFTFVRIIYAPIFVLLYFIPMWIKPFSPDFASLLAKIFMCIAIPCLLFAELTDFLDGFYARKNNEVSDFGKLFDPFADVILHLTTMICYMFTFGSEGGYMYPVLFMLLMIREFSQNFLRMVAAKQGVAIAARKGGKLKTVVYIVSGFYALFLECLVRFEVIPPFFGALKIAASVLFVICVILSYVSFIDYLSHFGKVLKEAAK